ncbi:MAG: nucleotidyltransferase domain-containing protein [Pseudoflavonifractor sp.]
MSELERIKAQIVAQFNPLQILLFGSQAKGTATPKSDFDICIVAKTENKRRLLTDLYCQVEAEKPIDFLLYTPEEWARCVEDKQSFAHKISREGVQLYGR